MSPGKNGKTMHPLAPDLKLPDESLPRVIAERYRVEFRLGSGAYSVVYQALDLALRKFVAIKLFNRSVTQSADARQALLDHASALSVLDHPGIAHVLDWGEVDIPGGRTVYVVTDLSRGVSLRRVLNTVEKLYPETAARLVARAASAIEYAHGQGVIHADIHPEDILVEWGDEKSEVGLDEARLLATDFGWTSLISRLSADDFGAGDGAHPSPDKIARRRLHARGGRGERADAYDLVVLLYELLVGRPPILPPASIRREVADFSPRKFNRSVPRWLERVVVDGLGDDETARFSHPSALRTALLASSVAPVNRSVVFTLEHARRGPQPIKLLGRTIETVARLFLLAIPALIAGAIGATTLTGIFAAQGLIADAQGSAAASFGPTPPANIPVLTGISFSEASARASAMGIKVVRGAEKPIADQPIDWVISQWPESGAAYRKNMAIRLSVSSGLAVPDVKGKSIEEARAYLAGIGWSVGEVAQNPTLGQPVGTVLDQTPASGTLSPNRGQIKLTVAAPPVNKAQGKPIHADGGDASAGAAVDNNPNTNWAAGKTAPAWIEVDLGAPTTVERIELLVAMQPNGHAAHEVYARDASGRETKVQVFTGETADGQVLTFDAKPPLTNIVRIRVLTVGSISWPGWREIRVY